MLIFWETVDVGMALFGGALLSLSTILNLAILGRISGLSGMTFAVSSFNVEQGAVWKFTFLAGIVCMCYSLFAVFGRSLAFGDYDYYIFDSRGVMTEDLSILGWLLGGLLVGVGTKVGNGCTSGHGVCGLARLSPRSFVAVGVFIGCGVAVATFKHYIPFLDNDTDFGDGYYDVFRVIASVAIVAVAIVTVVLCGYALSAKSGTKRVEPVLSFVFGLVFGLGLCLAGMCRRTKIIAFLTLREGWDPSLGFVMLAAVGINLPVFQYLLRKTARPLLCEAYEVPRKKTVDTEIVLGPALFGAGWGICGLCPGPGLVNTFMITHGILFLVSLVIGQIGASRAVEYFKRKGIYDESRVIN